MSTKSEAQIEAEIAAVSADVGTRQPSLLYDLAVQTGPFIPVANTVYVYSTLAAVQANVPDGLPIGTILGFIGSGPAPAQEFVIQMGSEVISDPFTGSTGTTQRLKANALMIYIRKTPLAWVFDSSLVGLLSGTDTGVGDDAIIAKVDGAVTRVQALSGEKVLGKDGDGNFGFLAYAALRLDSIDNNMDARSSTGGDKTAWDFESPSFESTRMHKIEASGAVNIHGIQAPTGPNPINEKIRTLFNNSAHAITFKHSSVTETVATQRIMCPDGVDVVVPARSGSNPYAIRTARFVYDGTGGSGFARWRVLSQ